MLFEKIMFNVNIHVIDENVPSLLVTSRYKRLKTVYNSIKDRLHYNKKMVSV